MSSDTIAGFCQRNKLSRGTFYNMQARGTGPRLMRDGRVIRISDEAERDWQREREAVERLRLAIELARRCRP